MSARLDTTLEVCEHDVIRPSDGSRGIVIVRKLLAILAITAFGALAWGGATAGAQTPTTTTTAAPTVFICTYELSATQVAAGGGSVQLTGVGPADANVKIFVNGVQVASAHTDATTGAFGPVTITITTTSTVSVSVDNYPATPCIGPASVNVEAAAALPRTGSNDTKPFVLIGVALLVVGAVLVLAARRRGHTRGRV